MDAQRHKSLREHFSSSDTTLRPILTSLNGDNSWLMSVPRPEAERTALNKSYFHVVFEPWLNGPTTMLSSWFVRLTPQKLPAIATPEAIMEVIKDTETIAQGSNPELNTQSTVNSDIDAIFLGFHYLDHLHEPTLKLFSPNIPILATPEAIAIIKPWNHFKTILTIPDLPLDAKTWRSPSLHPGSPWPSYLTPLRLPSGYHELNYLSAIIWSHPSTTNNEEVHDLILQTPHSLPPHRPMPSLSTFLASTPPITTNLAMLHGLKESYALSNGKNTFGAEGGLRIHRMLGGAKNWVVTHNSKLGYEGVMMKLLMVKDTERSVEWALEEEGRLSEKWEGVGGERKGGVPNVVAVENGGCFVLN